jgi:hypothetical protein
MLLFHNYEIAHGLLLLRNNEIAHGLLQLQNYEMTMGFCYCKIMTLIDDMLLLQNSPLTFIGKWSSDFE